MTQESLGFHDCAVFLRFDSETAKEDVTEQKSEDLTCGICKFWVGRCLKGHVGKVACSEPCESFEKRD